MSSLRAFVSLPKPYRFGSTAQTQPAQRSLIAANEGGEGRCQLEDERHLFAAAETLFAQTSRRPSSVLCRLYCRAGPLSLSTGFIFRQLEHLSLQSILQCRRSAFEAPFSRVGSLPTVPLQCKNTECLSRIRVRLLANVPSFLGRYIYIC